MENNDLILKQYIIENYEIVYNVSDWKYKFDDLINILSDSFFKRNKNTELNKPILKTIVPTNEDVLLFKRRGENLFVVKSVLDKIDEIGLKNIYSIYSPTSLDANYRITHFDKEFDENTLYQENFRNRMRLMERLHCINYKDLHKHLNKTLKEIIDDIYNQTEE